MHCVNCGAELGTGSGFCAKCGTRAGAAGVSSPTPQVGGGLQSNVAGLLCYLVGFITGIFFLAVDPYKHDKFVRFHAFQAIFVSAAWIVVYFLYSFLWTILPFSLWRVAWMLSTLISLGFVGLVLFLMYKAYSNEQFKLPFIGELAAKQA